MDYKYLTSLIEKKPIKPVIVNPNSNFVVCTYWWGKGNFNQNTSRPCIMFFEKLFIRIQNLCVEYLVRKGSEKNLYESIAKLSEFNNIIAQLAKDYSLMMFTDLDIEPKNTKAHQKAKAILKAEKKSPDEFTYKDTQQTEAIFHLMAKECIFAIMDNIKIISVLFKQLEALKVKVEKLAIIPKNLINEVTETNKNLNDEYEKIKEKLKVKRDIFVVKEFADFKAMSLYDILHKQLRYIAPIKYEQMILNWEKACIKAKCNYMSVEYPQFAEKGGYQLAINAKPLFIKKALESVGKRSVLYIDGDMFIRKYPGIFDLKDIDFMGRGWNIDPRSKEDLEDTVYYDPYTFETSGGTMWFSHTNLSKKLLSLWIEESSKKENMGKADDRILSLLFNTNKLLLSMKIIQLPIEYLWLSLDYDYFMPDLFYKSRKDTQKTIYIEHPECLTSEDTAASSGASSDRTPANYSYIGEITDPVSEQLHEYMMFPSFRMKQYFKTYLEYMSGAQYVNDGSPNLIEKGFVNLDNPDENEQMLYVAPYKQKYGNGKYAQDKSLTWNKVARFMLSKAKNIDMRLLNLSTNKKYGFVEIHDLSELTFKNKLDTSKVLALILHLLMKNKAVLYNPKQLPGYNKANYDALLKLEKETKGEMEFLFVPNFKGSSKTSANYIYKPNLELNQPMLFKPSEILIKFLTMFLSLNDLSKYLNYGSYEFVSRIRIAYVLNKKNKNVKSLNNKVGGYSLQKGINLLFNRAQKTRKHKNKPHGATTRKNRN